MKKMLTIALAVLLLAGVVVVLAEGALKSDTAPTVALPTEDVPTENVQTEDEQAQDGAQQPEAVPGEEAVADEGVQLWTLSGLVTQTDEGFFLMQDETLGEVQVNFGDDTGFEGVTEEELAAGQYVLVTYDGKLTRSLPPQVFALRVGMYALKGEITETGEDRVTLVRDEIGDEVILHVVGDMPELAVGDRVTAYTNGIMALSLPAQMTALYIEVQ